MLMSFVEELQRPILKDNNNAYTDNFVELLNTRSTAIRTTKLWVDFLIKPVLIIIVFCAS